MSIAKIVVSCGALAQIPNLDTGEPGFTSDTNDLYIGSPNGNVRIGTRSVSQNVAFDPIDCSDQVTGGTHFIFSPSAKLVIVAINGLIQKPSSFTLDEDKSGIVFLGTITPGDELIIVRVAGSW